MAVTFGDIFDVESEELNGVVTSLRRRGKVAGLTDESPTGYASQVFAAATLPSGGITIDGSYLALKRRRMWSDENTPRGSAWVDLFYERSSGTSGSVLRQGGRVSARQARTKRKRDGTVITVGYTKGGVTDTQVVELNVFLPTATPYIETFETTSTPDALAAQWVGKVNSTSWRSGAAGVWMCTDASYELVTAGATPTWKFSWAFQLSDDDSGWLPVKVYVDPTTGRSPADVTASNGIETEPYYQTANFASKF